MVDVAQNRAAPKYSPNEMGRRICWMLLQPLFRFSPRPCFAWRSFILRLFGATIGRDVHIYSSATIYYPWQLVAGDECAIGEYAFIYNLGQVTIGARATAVMAARFGRHGHQDG